MRGSLLLGLVLLTTPFPVHAQNDQRVGTGPDCPLPKALERPVTNFLRALQDGDLSSARISLGIVRQRAQAQGISNLFPLSAGVRHWLSEKGSDTPATVLMEVLDATIGLVPDDPWLHAHRVRAALRLGLSGVNEAFVSAADMLEALERNPPAGLQVLGSVAFHLQVSLVGCLLIVSLGILLRYFTRLAHDVGDLFPRAPTSAFSLLEMSRSRGLRWLVGSGVNRVLSGSLLALLAILPIVAGAGLVPTACLWTLLLTPYLRPAERVGAAMSLVVVSLLPWLAAWTLLPGKALVGEGAALWSSLQGIQTEEAEQRVRRRSHERPEDPWAALARSENENRQAPLSRPLLEAALNRLASANPDAQGVLYTAIGHTELRIALTHCDEDGPVRDRASRARDAYRLALEKAPGRPEVLEGLALSSALLGDAEGVRGALQEWLGGASERDLERIAAIRPLAAVSDACREVQKLERSLRLPPVPVWSLYLLDLDPWAPSAALPFHGLLVGRISATWLPVLGIGGLILLILITGFRERLHFSSRCPRCGLVSCPSCNRAATGFDYCPTCLFEQVRPAFLDPSERMAQEQRNLSGLKRRASLLLGLLVPGMGQVMGGRPLRGTLFLMLLTTALFSVALPSSPIVDPLFHSGVGRGLPLLPPLVLVAVFLGSAVDLWRHGGS